ncbi:MAG: hypothetical protein R6X34_10900 [Chloroflexota bacterium]
MAIEDFKKARQQAALEVVFGRLRGQSTGLLSYEEVARKLRVTGRSNVGTTTIPVEAIVGSVGRYSDFTRTFMPRIANDEQRWAKVKAAAWSVSDLPPIEVYQIDSAYFVLDGNHRVSIARQQGISHLDAVVTKVKTRVPFSANDDPEALILKEEYAAFLDYMHLDQLRPEAHLRVSAAGQYAHLENHIEVHRFFLEMAEERELELEEAVTRWYDEAYVPVVTAIREQDILRHFPGRTETDFYLWVAAHQASLQHELGWPIRPETAVTKLADDLAAKSSSTFTRLLRSVFRLEQNQAAWWENKLVDRYSQSLFGAVLVFISGEADCATALPTALTIARCDNAILYGLHISNSKDTDDLQTLFTAQCQAAAIRGRLALQTGNVTERMLTQSLLADLIVIAISPSLSQTPVELWPLLDTAPRPILLTSVPVTSPFKRIFLDATNVAARSNTLFTAAYFAENWQSGLTVGLVEGDDAGRRELDLYLGFHDVKDAAFVTGSGNLMQTRETAVLHQSDLVILSRPARQRERDSSWQQLPSFLNSGIPLLICP